MTSKLSFHAVENIPLIEPGDDLAATVIQALLSSDLMLTTDDILIFAQKIVSKAANFFVDLSTIIPGTEAQKVATNVDKDPRLVEVILSQSRSIVRQAPGVLITEHKAGWILANAGIDASNVDSLDGQEKVLLLPNDPDKICQELRAGFKKLCNVDIAVVINDSFGRPWRIGTTGVAIGAAGLASIWDRRGETDLFGRELKVSQQAVADELACAASLLQGQGAEGYPVILVRGSELGWQSAPEHPAADLMRAKEEDLFR